MLKFQKFSFQHRWDNMGLSLKTGTQKSITLACGSCEKWISSFAALHVDYRAHASWNLLSPARVVSKS